MKGMGNETVLNEGLALAMEFGENWLQPIQRRLGSKFPELTENELNHFDTICRKAMNEGDKFIYEKLDSLSSDKSTITRKDLYTLFESYMLQLFPWINTPNLTQLFSQGCYYAYKEGIDKFITIDKK
jgi:hypothetical protein